MDANELYHETRVLDSLRDLKDAVTGPEHSSARHEEKIVTQALADLMKSRNRVRGQLLKDGHSLARELEKASILAETGGSPGMYEFTATGQLLPILVGMDMRDPSGSGLNVPILGVDRDKETGQIFPL